MEEGIQSKFRRIRSIDLFRGFAMTMLLWSHTIWSLSYEMVHAEVYFIIILTDWFAVLAAPIFFVTVGIVVPISVEKRRKKKYSEISLFWHEVKRFLFLAGIGILYNFTLAPWIFNPLLNQPLEIFLNIWQCILDWSLLHSIGLFVIICYLLTKISPKYKVITLIGLCIGSLFFSHVLPLMNSFIFHVPFNSYNMFENLWFLRDFINYRILILQGNPLLIVGASIASIVYLGHVPIFPWLIFCVIGTFVGDLILELQKTKNQDDFKKKIYRMSIILICAGFQIEPVTWFWSPFFIEPLFYTFTMTGCVLLIFYVLVWYEDIKNLHSSIFGWIRNVGRLPLTFILMHTNIILMLFKFLDLFLGIPIWNQLTFPYFLLPTAGILMMFFLLAWYWQKYDFKYSIEWFQTLL
ncbi:MAG: heparan-alpha-glucosaminide N-acetyltransferase domain-containing protein [Candidatus Helarchaeota archaeon]